MLRRPDKAGITTQTTIEIFRSIMEKERQIISYLEKPTYKMTVHRRAGTGVLLLSQDVIRTALTLARIHSPLRTRLTTLFAPVGQVGILAQR
jgi:hypothetical protein